WRPKPPRTGRPRRRPRPKPRRWSCIAFPLSTSPSGASDDRTPAFPVRPLEVALVDTLVVVVVVLVVAVVVALVDVVGVAAVLAERGRQDVLTADLPVGQARHVAVEQR